MAPLQPPCVQSTRLEKVIDGCLNRLEHRLGNLNPDWYDDVESLASGHHKRDHHNHHLVLRGHHQHRCQNGSPLPPSSRVVKISCGTGGVQGGFQLPFGIGSNGSSRHSGSNHNTVDEKLRRKTKKLEEENKALKQKLQQLQQLVEKNSRPELSSFHTDKLK